MSVPAAVPAAAVPGSVVGELRRTRRRQRVSAIHWVDALYQVYVTALAVVAGVLFLSSVIGDERLGVDAVDRVADDGPALLGLVAAVAIGIGVRSGCRGGPLAVEAADVRHVLLAPVDRGVALRSPALRQLRFGAFAAAAVGATIGQFAGRRMVGHGAGPAWVASAALFGVTVVALALGSALVASGRRLPTWLGTTVAAVVLALAVADVAGVVGWSPTDPVGRIGVLPLDFAPIGLVAPAVAIALVVAGLAGVAGISLEAAERRTALVGQVRFAVTLQDLRTVMVLRRQLAADQPRARPWFALRRRSRFPVWQRGWRGVLRFPLARVGRLVVLAAAAGIALRGVWDGTTPLLAAAGLALWVAALDAVEPLSQETDHPTRTDAMPRERGEVLVRHLVVPSVVMVGLAGVAVAAAVAGGARDDELAVLGVAVLPLAAGATAGAVISVLMGAPKPVSEFALATPEIAGAKTALRTIWPALVAVAGTLPVWAGARAAEVGDPMAAALTAGAVAVVLAGLTAGWVRQREAIHLWWEATAAAAQGRRPGTDTTADRDADDEPEAADETKVTAS